MSRSRRRETATKQSGADLVRGDGDRLIELAASPLSTEELQLDPARESGRQQTRLAEDTEVPERVRPLGRLTDCELDCLCARVAQHHSGPVRQTLLHGPEQNLTAAAEGAAM